MLRSARIPSAVAVAVSCSLALTGCHGSSKSSAAAVTTSQTPTVVAQTTPAAAASAPVASSTPAASSPVATSPAPVTSSPAAPAGGGAKCTDLTNAAASAAVGKTTTVALDTGATGLAGLTVCDVMVANEGYSIQLDVDSANGAADYAADQSVAGDTGILSGVGDKAFTSAQGVEALKGNVDIQVIGPAGPVLDNNFTTPTAIAKAMAAAVK
jgi:hypothetical protein